jgi:hypothetical protein
MSATGNKYQAVTIVLNNGQYGTYYGPYQMDSTDGAVKQVILSDPRELTGSLKDFIGEMHSGNQVQPEK